MGTDVKRDLNSAITKIVVEASSAQNPEQLTILIKKRLDELLPSDRLGVLFWDPASNRMTHEAHAGMEVPSDALPLGVGFPPNIREMISTTGIETGLHDFPGTRMSGYVESGVQTMAHVPITSKGGLEGTITLFSRQPNAYTESDLAILLKLSDAVSPFLENTALVLQLRNEITVRNAMSELTSRVITASSVKEIYEEIHRCLKGLLTFQRFTVLRIHPDRVLEHAFIRGKRVKGLNQGKKTVLTAEGVMHILQPHIEKNINIPDPIYEGEPHTRILSVAGLNVHNLQVPLAPAGKQLGAISVWGEEQTEYTNSDLELLSTFAKQVAPVIEQLELREAVQRESQFRMALAEVTKTATEAPGLFEALESVYQVIVELIPNDRFVVTTPNSIGTQQRIFVKGLEIPGHGVGDLLPAQHSKQITDLVAKGQSHKA